MTIFMNLHAMDSVINPQVLLPIAFVPYIILGFGIYSSRTRVALACSLGTAIVTIGLGFWYYFDGLYVRFTTLNAPLFISVPLIQLAPAVVGLVLAR